MFDKLFGVLFALVGLFFLLLLTLAKVKGELDLKVSAILLCTGVIFVWIGCTWFFPRRRRHMWALRDECDRYLLKLRRPAEFIAAVGVMITGIRAMALLYGEDPLPRSALWVFASAPVIVGLFALRILSPGASQSGLLPDDVVRGWSTPTRRFVNLLLRLRLLGYPATLLVWPDFQDLAPWIGHIEVQFVASIFITLLYASHVLVLHLGQMRPSQNASS